MGELDCSGNFSIPCKLHFSGHRRKNHHQHSRLGQKKSTAKPAIYLAPGWCRKSILLCWGDPAARKNHFRSHATSVNRLAQRATCFSIIIAPSDRGTTSTVHEYALDETNKIATHIWTYTPSPAIPGPVQGNAQRSGKREYVCGVGWARQFNSRSPARECPAPTSCFRRNSTILTVISYRGV